MKKWMEADGLGMDWRICFVIRLLWERRIGISKMGIYFCAGWALVVNRNIFSE
jgi:hypothetical protein